MQLSCNPRCSLYRSLPRADLKFFEPYLWVVLVEWGLSLGQVGLLVSVEKVTCYFFELPSG